MHVVVFAKALYKQIDERVEMISEQLALGAASGYDQYRQMVGEIQGLNHSREMLKALLEKTDDDVEETLRS
jgi:Mg2+/Co2+ transporter CorB